MAIKFNPLTGQFDLVGDTNWGNIQGTLSDQADLQAELDDKMNINGDNSDVDAFFFNIAFAAPAHQEGTIFYDNLEHTLAVYNDNSDITHQLGQENLIRVYNNTGVTIANGKPVYITGSEGTEYRPTIALAQANDIDTSDVIGLTTSDILNNSYGYVTIVGLVNGVDTSSFSVGDVLYLSNVTAGGLTNINPGINLTIQIGHVLRSDAVNGRIAVNLRHLGSVAVTAVKTVFFRPERVGTVGDYKVKAMGQGGNENFTFLVPQDFQSLTSLELVYAPVNTVDPGKTADLNSDYGSIGESITTHSETVLGNPVTGTAGIFSTMDISGVFSNMSAGDICGININLNNIGTTLNVFGIRLRYA